MTLLYDLNHEVDGYQLAFEEARTLAKTFFFLLRAISLLVRDQSRPPDAHVNVPFPHGDPVYFDLSPAYQLTFVRCQDTIEDNSQKRPNGSGNEAGS